jgi:hypothetical protein
MKHFLIYILTLSAVLLNLSVSAEEKNIIQYKVSEANWTTKNVIEWRKSGGFQLKDKTFGAIETKKRVPFSNKAIITINAKKLFNVDYTVQLQMFDQKGDYLGFLDVLTKQKKRGEKKIRLSKFQKKILKGTYDYAIKIWIGGKVGGYIEISKFIYQY